MKTARYVLALLALILALAANASGQTVELACPNGTTVITPTGQVVNPSTGNFRQWLCVSSVNGAVSMTATVGGASPGGNSGDVQFNNGGAFGAAADLKPGTSFFINSFSGALSYAGTGSIAFSNTSGNIALTTIAGNFNFNATVGNYVSDVGGFYQIVTDGGAGLILGASSGSDAPLTWNGSTGGSATWGVAATAGTPNRVNVPTATGAANAYLQTNGAATQQTTWTTALSCGQVGAGCVITGLGGTSGSATITWPAVAGTITNAIVFSNAITVNSTIQSNGTIQAGSSSALCNINNSCLRSNAAGISSLNNNGNSANGQTQVVFGLIGNATNPEFLISGLNMDVRRGDGTTGGGTFSVNGGTPIVSELSATATLDFANQAAAGCNDLTITVTGAALGDTTHIGVPNGSVPNGTAFFTSWVSAANTVSIRYCNLVSGDPASGTFRATVWKF